MGGQRVERRRGREAVEQLLGLLDAPLAHAQVGQAYQRPVSQEPLAQAQSRIASVRAASASGHRPAVVRMPRSRPAEGGQPLEGVVARDCFADADPLIGRG